MKTIRNITATFVAIATLTLMSAAAHAAAFTPGNLAILQADAASTNNSTFSIVELNTTTAGQSAVQTISINGTTMPNALRQTGSGSSSPKLADSGDGTLLVFTGFNTNNTVGNINTNIARGVGTLDASGNFTLQTTYTGANGYQVRGVATIDNSTWYVGDQNGIYTNSSSVLVSSNIAGIKSFGATVYAMMSAKGSTNVSTVSASGKVLTPLPGLTNDANVVDFYMIASGNNGSTYDVIYTMDNTNGSSTAGAIFKYSLVSGTWVPNGYYSTGFGGYGICAAKSGSSAVLYATTGTGATAANSVIKLTDTAGYNSTIAINTGNNVTLFTCGATPTLKGIAFAPAVYPTAYGVTGGGSYCSGGSGVVIGLANSQSGVNYQLFRNGGATAVGSYVAGTGSAISFDNQTVADTYTVVATNTTGNATTTMTGSATVTVNPIPSSAITAATTVCPNSTGNTASVPDAGGSANYGWTISGGSITAGSVTRTITYTANASGSILLGCTVTNSGGCYSNAGSATVSISAAVTTTAGNGGPYCVGQTISLSATGSAGDTYAWTGPNGFTSSAQNPTIANATAVNAGDYIVTRTTACGSSPSSTTTLTVNPIPNSTITASSSVCGNSTGNAASVTAIGGGSYGWTISNGNITAGDGTAAITYTAGASGLVTLDCTVTNSSGCCSNASSATVSINALPSATVTPTATSIPANSTGNTASVSDAGAGASYTWTVSGGGITAGQGTTAVTYTAGSSGTLTLSCAVTNSNGCGLIASATVTMRPAFTKGNLAVLQAAGNANNTTCSILELSSTSSNSTPVNTIPISATGANALRISGSAASTAYLSESADRTLLAFTGANTSDTSSNINTYATRGVGTLDYNTAFALQTTYTVASGNQTRSATSLDDVNWIIGDQSGIYTNNAATTSAAGNFRGVKSFGGMVYLLQQAASSNVTVVSTLAADGATLTGLPGLTNDNSATDFYLIQSGHGNGTNHDVLYTVGSDAVKKYSLVNGVWTANGSHTATNGFALCAATSGGGAALYVTTGSGSATKNSVIELTDAAGYNAAINITATTTLYTTPAGTILKGIAFAPQCAAANDFTLTFTKGLPFKVPVATILAHAAGGGVTLSGFDTNSANGVAITSNNGTLFYNGPLTGEDSLHYTVASGAGGCTDSGLISIVTDNSFGGQSNASVNVTNSIATVTFLGVADFRYVADRSTNLNAGMGWVPISTNTPASDGPFQVIDNYSIGLGGIPPAQAFYRLRFQP